MTSLVQSPSSTAPGPEKPAKLSFTLRRKFRDGPRTLPGGGGGARLVYKLKIHLPVYSILFVDLCGRKFYALTSAECVRWVAIVYCYPMW